MKPTSAPAFPLAEADLCVKCGLCLPHCPTYALSQHEADSPRGRISLMQGLATGLIQPSVAADQHLDGCLGCRNCEPVCPAKVPYGKLLEAGRAVQATRRPQFVARLLAAMLSRRALRPLLRGLLRISAPLMGVAQRALRGTRLQRWASLLPTKISSPPAASIHADAPQLFTGCAGELLDGQTLRDAQSVLQHIGHAPGIPPAQACCGALHRHAGLDTQAAQLAQDNRRAFAGNHAILYCASGCGATLREDAEIGARAQDAQSYVLRHWPHALIPRALPARVALHLPCTQRNVTRSTDASRALLQKIPQLELLPMAGGMGCCGAAGSHFIAQATMADALLEPLLESVTALRPDYVVTSNVGCSLHLAAGLRRRGLTVPVLHPLSLLRQQLSPLPAATSTAPPVRPG